MLSNLTAVTRKISLNWTRNIHYFDRKSGPSLLFMHCALDFSKAFDTVRHVTLLEKMVMLDVPDYTYITGLWSVDTNIRQHLHFQSCVLGIVSKA